MVSCRKMRFFKTDTYEPRIADNCPHQYGRIISRFQSVNKTIYGSTMTVFNRQEECLGCHTVFINLYVVTEETRLQYIKRKLMDRYNYFKDVSKVTIRYMRNLLK